DVSLQPHLIEYFRLYSRLDCNIAIQRLAVNGKTRHLYRSLDVHPVIDNIRNKLRMCQWLIGAAHDSEADVVASSTFSAGGDSGSLIVSRSAAHRTALTFRRQQHHDSRQPDWSGAFARQFKLGKAGEFCGEFYSNHERVVPSNCRSHIGHTWRPVASGYRPCGRSEAST